MSIEALPFVNWIFWGALSAGGLLVVGGTELLGGTTRGYRLFMAGLLATCAAILLLSELNLASGTWADATSESRRGLVWMFFGLTVAYLLASIADWPRGGLAVAAGLAGLTALASLAAAEGSLSTPFFGLQLVLSALALGAAGSAMLLGHWYLVTPKLSPAPLLRMMRLLVGVLVVQGLVCAAVLLLVSSGPLDGSMAWITWLRLGVGIGLPIGIGLLAILASSASSLQATTGLLYIGLVFVMAGSIAGASITLLTGVPI